MPNTSVYEGADGALTLSVPPGPEGEIAQAVMTNFDMVSLGRVQNVTVEVTSEVRPFNEIGQVFPTQLRTGNISVTGTIERAFINGSLLRLLLGPAGDGRPANAFTHPAFNITLVLENTAVPGVRSTLTIHGAQIDNWVHTIPQDDFVMDHVHFQALYATVTDEG
jgi:hypothetical protein